MRAYLELGPAPCNEQSAEVGTHDYWDRAVNECRAYAEAIRRKLGREPDGAVLTVNSFRRGLGTYYQVVCHYDQDSPNAIEYAMRCKRDAPATWAEVGMRPPSAPMSRAR
jgi:hypothetical protein